MISRRNEVSIRGSQRAKNYPPFLFYYLSVPHTNTYLYIYIIYTIHSIGQSGLKRTNSLNNVTNNIPNKAWCPFNPTSPTIYPLSLDLSKLTHHTSRAFSVILYTVYLISPSLLSSARMVVSHLVFPLIILSNDIQDVLLIIPVQQTMYQTGNHVNLKNTAPTTPSS